MQPAGEHFSAEEFDLLLRSAGSSGGLAPSPARQSHLEACESCRRKLDLHRQARERLRQLTEPAPTNFAAATDASADDCPAMDQWTSLAAGLLTEAKCKQLLDHASGCGSCGVALRFAMEDIAQEPADAELQQIRRLQSASPEWRKSLARGLSRPQPSRLPAWLRVAQAAAVIVVVAGAAWLGSTRVFPSPARLVARAYTEQRPFELRIPGAAYAPVRIEKRNLSSSFNRPPSLLDAQSKIAQKLQDNPNDIEMLGLRARIEMLEWDPESAIATLNRALDQKPDDPDLLAGLGAAYALRADAKNNAIDYGRAIEHLSKSLRAKPDLPETLFNRAIVYQRMFLYDEAMQDWRKYLELDPKGEWSAEASRRLAEIANRKKARRDALDKITDDPLAFLSRVNTNERFEPESYLNVAIKNWLPRRWDGEANQRALDKLAALYETRHHDSWLRDVLAAHRSDAMTEGLRALGEAVAAGEQDNRKLALDSAKSAAELLRQAGSEAGAIRADAEHVYALHMVVDAPACIASAELAERRTEARGYYPWILAQVRIELGICRSMVGNAGPGQQVIAQAMEGARAAGYHSLELRARGMLLGGAVNAGNLLGAWDGARDGLRAFWDGVYQGNRAQQFYTTLRRAAESLEMNNSAFALSRASVSVLEETSHRSIEALNRIRVARNAAQAGLSNIASEEFARAEELLEKSSAGRQSPENLLLARIGRAEADMSAGNLDGARTRLYDMRDQAGKTRLATVLLPYHLLTGEVERHSNAWPDAEQSYRAAINQCERRLPSLKESAARFGAVQAAGKAYRGLVESTWRRGDIRTALRLWEWFRSGERPGPHLENEPDFTSLRQETFLVYADLPGGLVAWVFDDRGIEGHRLAATPAEIEKVARRFADHCADLRSSEKETKRDGRQLYDWLIAPLAHRLDPSRTLVIEPDRIVAAIPFQALVGSDNRYLSERFATVTATGLADYLDRVRVSQVSPRDRALIVSNPLLGPSATRTFPPLLQAAREGAAIAARFAKAERLEGSAATVPALERLRPETEVLHFAGHGFSNAGNGGLLLAPVDPESATGVDVLNGNRLAGQDWTHCRLAVLSACSSGAGEVGPVNPESLVRRLLWSGAARVVASRWNADAETSLQFMDSFYAAALSGSGAAQSLRTAASRIREGDTTRHPYFWAGFQLFGSR